MFKSLKQRMNITYIHVQARFYNHLSNDFPLNYPYELILQVCIYEYLITTIYSFTAAQMFTPHYLHKWKARYI